MEKVNWPEALKPLLKKYKNNKHPLHYKNLYQLLVAVVLSARDSDDHINKITPDFFKSFSSMTSLARAGSDVIADKIKGVRGSQKKAGWLHDIASQIKQDKNIPVTMEGLIKLPGIGRKSANVIKREAGAPAEGIMVDLHTVRVAPRLGIASGTDPKKIEQQMMETLPQKQWDAGMAMSFLGREICRPKPHCDICLMNKVCAYYQSQL